MANKNQIYNVDYSFLMNIFFNYLLSQYAVRVTMNSPYFYMKTVYENLENNTYFQIDSIELSIQGIQNLLVFNAMKQYVEPNVRKDDVKQLAAGKNAKVMLSNARNTIGKVYSILDEIKISL